MCNFSRHKLSLPPEEAVLPFTYHLFLFLCYPSLCLWLGNRSELEPTTIWAGLVLACISSWSVSLQGCKEFFCASRKEGTTWRQGWSRYLEKRELRHHQLRVHATPAFFLIVLCRSSVNNVSWILAVLPCFSYSSSISA